MILNFKTRRSQNGNCRYLTIDTEAKVYSTECQHMITHGIEIKTSDYKKLVEELKRQKFFES